MNDGILTAPPGGPEPYLGHTLVSHLDDACRIAPDGIAFGWNEGGASVTRTWSEFRTAAHEVAAGLEAFGIEAGERVVLACGNGWDFVVADMGALLAGIVDAPVYASASSDDFRHIVDKTEACVLFLSEAMRVRHAAVLPTLSSVKTVVLVGGAAAPDGVSGDVVSLADLQERGRSRLGDEAGAPERWRAARAPEDLATIIYTSGTTGRPKGVMLSHQNLSYVSVTGMYGLSALRPDGAEVAMVVLPLAHVFQRSFHYACMAWGSANWFCDPVDVAATLRAVRPTVFAAVPRLLERIYEKMHARRDDLDGARRRIYEWALGLAARYDMQAPPRGLDGLRYRLADRLVFSKWRDATGGRLKYVICGGAPLDARVTRFFAAAGIEVIQGYGLTETSPTLAFNRAGANHPGTVGWPIEGAELRIAEDGELLARGHGVMQGYWRDPEATREVIDEDGWVHTGDIAEVDADGMLRITDRKKSLFKLSTGLYVTPQPLETALCADPLIEQAVVLGPGRKFCAAVLFPAAGELAAWASKEGVAGDVMASPELRDRIQKAVDAANTGLAESSRIRRFVLCDRAPTIDDGVLTPTLKIRRAAFMEEYAAEIEALYA